MTILDKKIRPWRRVAYISEREGERTWIKNCRFITILLCTVIHTNLVNTYTVRTISSHIHIYNPTLPSHFEAKTSEADSLNEDLDSFSFARPILSLSSQLLLCLISFLQEAYMAYYVKEKKGGRKRNHVKAFIAHPIPILSFPLLSFWYFALFFSFFLPPTHFTFQAKIIHGKGNGDTPLEI